MRVRNKKPILFAKSVELDRDMMPGETALVMPDFEQSERIQHALSSGAIEITHDADTGLTRAKRIGDMIVALPPDADVEGDTYYTDRVDTQDLPPLVKAAREKAAAEEEKTGEEQHGEIKERKIVDDGLTHVVKRPQPKKAEVHYDEDSHFPGDAIGSQLVKEVEKQSTLEERMAASSEAKQQIAEFAKRRGGARVKYVDQMTDVGAMHEALKLVKTGKAKEALEAKIIVLTKPKTINL